MTGETFKGARGTEIFFRSWRPPGAPRGVVIIQHGFKSHSGVYDSVAQRLCALGLSVYALDMRGHGRSHGERLWVDQFDDYVLDLDELVVIAKQRDRGLPVFLLGHSAGGVVASLYAVEHQPALAGLVCESIAQELPAPRLALAALQGLARIAPHAHVLGLKDEDFSRDPEFVARMKHDPLIPDQKYAANTASELVRADERLAREFDRMKLPLLLLHGTADHAARPHGSQRFYDVAPSRDKTLRLYDGYYHDLLHDMGGEAVMADVTDWLEPHLAAA